jgi:TetR/AcrR family transcriptional regulator
MKSHTRTRVEPVAEEAGKGQIRQINEARILSAAERVFAGAGFGGATMAAIADQAALPKANLHYYFGAKRDLYRAVLAQTLQDWLEPTHVIVPEADPKTAIEAYIRAKMALSIARPHASRVFANELLHGAPMIKALLITDSAPVGTEQVGRHRAMDRCGQDGAGESGASVFHHLGRYPDLCRF